MNFLLEIPEFSMPFFDEHGGVTEEDSADPINNDIKKREIAFNFRDFFIFSPKIIAAML